MLKANVPRSAELRAQTAKGLGIEEPECAIFLDRLQVREMPLRSSIKEMNLAFIGELESSLTAATLAVIEDGLVQEISDAMALERLGDAWPRCVFRTQADEDDVTSRVAAKRITAERLSRFQKLLVPSLRRPLLRPGDSAAHESSQLVRKLRDGGANDQLVQLAKTLRSSAVRHEIEGMSRDLLGDDDRLEDLRQRLLLYTSLLPEMHGDGSNPAARIFNAARSEIQANAEIIDPYWLFGRDTPTLLGELCELSDQCFMRWS